MKINRDLMMLTLAGFCGIGKDIYCPKVAVLASFAVDARCKMLTFKTFSSTFPITVDVH